MRSSWTILALTLLAGSTSCMFLLDTDTLKEGSGGADSGVESSIGGAGGSGQGGSSLGGSGGIASDAPLSDVPDIPDANPEIVKACQDLATAYCTAFNVCTPFYTKRIWGDVPTCTERYRMGCLIEAQATDSSLTPAAIQNCATELLNVQTPEQCVSLYSGGAANACTPPPGPRDDGMPCLASSQCKSSYCSLESAQQCGACKTRQPSDGPCSKSADCAPTLVCNGTNCVSPASKDQPCNPQTPCQIDLACVHAADASNEMRCEPRKKANEVCTIDPKGISWPPKTPKEYESLLLELNRECDVLAGLYCQPDSDLGEEPTSGKCQQIELASAGGTCGVSAAKLSGITLCRESGTCSLVGNTCQATAEDGSPCGGTTGQGCLPPAVCSGGKCQLPDPASCSTSK